MGSNQKPIPPVPNKHRRGVPYALQAPLFEMSQKTPQARFVYLVAFLSTKYVTIIVLGRLRQGLNVL
jgi:hypothetical protein